MTATMMIVAALVTRGHDRADDSTGAVTISAMAVVEIKHAVEHADQRIKLVVRQRVVRRL